MQRKMTVSDIESVLLSSRVAGQKYERVPLEQAQPTTASCISGVFNLSNNIVGSGIMSLPFVVKILGVVPGVVLIIVSGILAKYSINILLRFSNKERAYTYEQLMVDAFGRVGEIWLQISVVVGVIGSLMVYLIIVGDVISGSNASGIHHSGVLEELFGEYWWTGRAFVLTFVTAFVLIPIAWRKRMDSLRHTSAIAVGSAIFFVFIVIGLTIYKLATGTIQPSWFPHINDLSSVWNLFTAIPVLVTAYICHYNVHTIQNELKDPSQISTVVNVSLGVCGMIYLTTGTFGFLLFGDLTASDVLSNFDTDLGVPYTSLLNTTVRLSYAVHILLALPVVFHAVRLHFDGLVFNSSIPLASNNRRFAITTLGLLLVILLGAIFIPNVWIAIQFIGAPTSVMMSLIFPAAIVLRDHPKIATKEDKVVAWVLIAVSIFSTLVALYSNVISLL